MRLLIDSDVFCKLGVGNLLDESLAVLGAQACDCGRLPALPHMLRRGKLPKTYGAEACAALVPLAESIQTIPTPDAVWLDRLTPVQSVDPGEAQLFALAAQNSLMVVTGDKRALRAVRNVPGYVGALSGRVVALEAILMALCDRMGHVELRRRFGPVAAIDNMVKVCFSEGNPDPREALESYFRDLIAEVRPLVLWEPHRGGAA
jgi:hypothetical protein